MNNFETTTFQKQLDLPDLDRWRRERIQRQQGQIDRQELRNDKLSASEQHRKQRNAERAFNAEKERRQSEKDLRNFGRLVLATVMLTGAITVAENFNKTPAPRQTIETDYDNPNDNYQPAEEIETDYMLHIDSEPMLNQVDQQTESLEQEKQLTVEKTIDLNQAGEFKSFMPYTTITDETSNQWFLQQSENAFTTESGLRAFDYQGETLPMVAVGTGATDQIGKIIKVDFNHNNQEHSHYFVVGDIKDNIDTLDDNLTHKSDASVVEFLVDKQALANNQQLAKAMGDLSYYENKDFDFNGQIQRITVFDQAVDFDSPNH